MPLLTRKQTAALVALPALLVPVIEIPLVLWARATFLERHPDYLDDPPTISRSINDPFVGAPFADLILVITALIAMMTPVLVWSYALAISRLELSRARRATLHVLLLLFLVFQITASTGMVMTTQYTFDINHDLHMLGSYIFFAFQAMAILVAATLCRLLHGEHRRQDIDDEEWQFRPAMHRFRFHFALVIVGLVVLYGILFMIKDHIPPDSAYVFQIIYTQCEVIVIGCYVLFLGTYAVDVYDMVHRGKLPARLGAPSAQPRLKSDAPSERGTPEAGPR